MDRLFADQIVYITGAASGIGRACAVAFAREGAAIVLLDIDEVQAIKTQEIVAEADGDAWVTRCDVSAAEAVTGAMRQAAEQHGAPDVAVNCAGVIMAPAAVGDVEESEGTG